MSTVEIALIGVGLGGMLLFFLEKLTEFAERRAHQRH